MHVMVMIYISEMKIEEKAMVIADALEMEGIDR